MRISRATTISIRINSPSQRTRYSIIQTKTEDEAKAVLDELNKGGDFAALAKEKSADIISARNGGDMGWLRCHYPRINVNAG
ncbi:peptidylprolyl isomerase [Escherichia coli]